MLLRGMNGWEKRRAVLQIALLAIVILILPFAMRPIQFSWSAITAYPYQLDREEGFLLNQAVQLRHGNTIYPDLRDYPYTMGAYTPGYPLAHAGALLFTDPGLPPGRLIVLASAISIALLLFVYTATETKQPVAAAIGPLLFFTSYAVNHWIGYARVDFLALMFGAAGLFMAGRGSPKFWIPASGVLFAAAFYTKQTQLLAPAAVLAALLIQRDWRLSIRFAAFTAGLALVVGIVLIALTRGQFWMHTVLYNANEFHWDSVWPMLRHLWRFAHFNIAAACVCLAMMGFVLWKIPTALDAAPEGARLRLAAVIVYTLLGGLSILSVGKAGSAENYFIEFHFACGLAISLGTGLMLAGMEAGRKSRVAMMAGAIVVALLMLLQAASIRTDFYQSIVFRRPLVSDEASYAQAALMEVITEEGEILSEDAVLTILARKPVLYQSFIMSQLAREGKWDPAPFIDDLRNKRFDLIVTLRPMDTEYFYGFTKEMRDAVLENYTLERELYMGRRENRYVYRPAD